MCLAVPAKIVSIDGDKAQVDFGGTKKSANISMVDAKVGDWVVVHAGFAIEVMDEKEATETVKLWNEFIGSGDAELKRPERVSITECLRILDG